MISIFSIILTNFVQADFEWEFFGQSPKGFIDMTWKSIYNSIKLPTFVKNFQGILPVHAQLTYIET